MPVRTFYMVSQLGMLPATVVYVNAGTQSANLQSASGVLSSKVLGSLALIGVLPLLMRAGLARLAPSTHIRHSRGRFGPLPTRIAGRG